MAGTFGRDAVAQSVRATYSAQGARSLLQVSAVLLNWEAKSDIRRTQPFAVSKKSDLRNGSWAIHSVNPVLHLWSYRFEDIKGERVTVGTSVCRPTPNSDQDPVQ